MDYTLLDTVGVEKEGNSGSGGRKETVTVEKEGNRGSREGRKQWEWRRKEINIHYHYVEAYAVHNKSGSRTARARGGRRYQQANPPQDWAFNKNQWLVSHVLPPISRVVCEDMKTSR